MSDPTETNENNSLVNFDDEFAKKLASFLRQGFQNSSTPSSGQVVNPDNLGEIVITTKLSGDNYPLWANLMKRAIGGKGLTSHISKESDSPPTTDPNHAAWQKLDHCVFGWIINNMEPELVNEVSQYPTAKELWEGLAVTYGSGGDSLQVYDLHVKASILKQGDTSLEQLWQRFQNIWMSIDRKKPNKMKCPEDIAEHNKDVHKTRLYQFLMALNSNHEATRREILKVDPLPSVKNAYAIVRREATNESVLKPTVETRNSTDDSIGAGLASRGSSGGRSGQTLHRGDDQRFMEDKSRLVCTNCGGKKHTKDQCFLIVGYPDWWDEMKKRRAARNWSNRGNRGTPVTGGATGLPVPQMQRAAPASPPPDGTTQMGMRVQWRRRLHRLGLAQDIQTGTIVGRGTERRGLYYVDEVAQQSIAMLTHGSTDRQAWL